MGLIVVSIAFYMNASRLREFSCVLTDRMAAGLYPALLQPIPPLRATMKSADSRLIPLPSSKLFRRFRFSESRSYLVCHHIRFPAQPFDVSPWQKLISYVELT